MKLGVKTEIAAGSPRVFLVCLGALDKLMALHHRHQLLLLTNAMCPRIRGRTVDFSALTRMAVRAKVAAGESRTQVHHGVTTGRQAVLSFRMLTRRFGEGSECKNDVCREVALHA